MPSRVCVAVALSCMSCPAAVELRAGAVSAQPEYARPHTHQWEKAKTAFIDGAKEIDSMIKEAKAAFNSSSKIMEQVLNRRCSPENAADRGLTYTIDNSKLRAQTNGLGYRFSRDFENRDLHTVAHWGTTVQGKDMGDDWLKVGDCFLPMKLQGIPVVAEAPAATKMAPQSMMQVGSTWHKHISSHKKEAATEPATGNKTAHAHHSHAHHKAPKLEINPFKGLIDGINDAIGAVKELGDSTREVMHQTAATLKGAGAQLAEDLQETAAELNSAREQIGKDVSSTLRTAAQSDIAAATVSEPAGKTAGQ